MTNQHDIIGRGPRLQVKQHSGSSLVQMKDKISISTIDLAECLSTAMDLISPLFANHQRRVGYIALRLAEALGLSPSEQKSTFIAGLLHDCGALSMRDRVVTLNFDLHNNPTVSYNHSEAGYQLLKNFKPFADAASFIRYHHHPWADGVGALCGKEQVPMNAHILHLADRIDVLIDMQQHILLQKESIFRKIKDTNGLLFVPSIVEAFMDLADKEYFWLDIANVSMGSALSSESSFGQDKLYGDDVLAMINLFGHMIDFRSRFTATHSDGVSACATSLARFAGFSEEECTMIQLAGFLHDLGKLAIPLEILEKPSGLSKEEFNFIKSHAYYTYRILKKFRDLETINQWASLHHERPDGKGYPFHFKDEKLPTGSKIMAVADVFTAITEDRPYRDGMNVDQATRVLLEMSRAMALDHNIVLLLLDNFDDVNHVRMVAQGKSLKNYKSFEQYITKRINTGGQTESMLI